MKERERKKEWMRRHRKRKGRSDGEGVEMKRGEELGKINVRR